MYSDSNDEYKKRVDNDELFISYDNHNRHALRTVIKPGLVVPCRSGLPRGANKGNLPSDYSILIKFSYIPTDEININFLNITNQLSVSFSSCGGKETMTIQFPSCSSNSTFDLNFDKSETYHKISIQVKPNNLIVRSDCIEVLNMFMENCPVLCDSMDIHVAQPGLSDPESKCRTKNEKVFNGNISYCTCMENSRHFNSCIEGEGGQSESFVHPYRIAWCLYMSVSCSGEAYAITMPSYFLHAGFL